MKRILLVAFVIVAAVSCRRDYPLAPEKEPEPPQEQLLPPARITQTTQYAEERCTAFNFEYPSLDPYGKAATLSGTIVIGDEISKDAPARGLFLYNHFTSYAAGECPSRGDLGAQKLMVGSGLISISADYYGFGVTQDKPQAYALAGANGQASADALAAAIDLLADMGYTWDNVIFNMGYSQGAQSAIAALKALKENHPEIRFTRTYAGGGLYDVKTTYRNLASSGQSPMPDVVVSALLSYNEFYALGIPREKLFKEPLLSNLDEWFLSKKHTLAQIEVLMDSDNLQEYVTPDVLDPESEISKQFYAVMDKESLCQGWEPRLGEKITLVHNKADDIVPVENTEKLIHFFREHGVTVKSRVENFSLIPLIRGPHNMGAVVFILDTLNDICSTLDIRLWVDASQVIQLVKSLPAASPDLVK